MNFVSSESTVMKWVLNRPFQSKFVEALKELADTSQTMSNPTKCLRDNQVLKSERFVESLKNTISKPVPRSI